MDRKKNIAIVFANLKGNLGDFAILHAMLEELRVKRPSSQVDVYSHGFVDIDDARFEAFRRTAPQFRYCGVTYQDNRSNSCWLKFFRSLNLRKFYQSRRIARISKASISDAGRFAAYGEIFIAGGAQWTGDHSGVAMFGTLRAIAHHNKNILMFPFSVSPSLLKLNSEPALAADLSVISAPLIVRDTTSKHLLQKLNVPAVAGADTVFSLAYLGRSLPVAKIGIKPRVLFVVTMQDEALFALSIMHLRSEEYSLCLLTTCAVEDGSAQQRIADAHGAQFLSPMTWQEVVEEMKASEIVVTNRLHGLILASFAEVPVIPLIDRTKVAAVVNDARLPVSIKKIEELDAEALEKVRMRRREIVDALSGYRDRSLLELRSPI